MTCRLVDGSRLDSFEGYKPEALMRFKSLLGCISAETTFVFLGISILASGGFAAFFVHLARISIAIVTCLFMGVSPLMPGKLNPGKEEDRGNRWVLSAFGVLGVLLAFLPPFSSAKVSGFSMGMR